MFLTIFSVIGLIAVIAGTMLAFNTEIIWVETHWRRIIEGKNIDDDSSSKSSNILS